MKTIPPPCPEPDNGVKYWRSLDELAEKPEFQQWLQREFQAGASEFTDPVSRRNFVKLMSASFLLAGVGLTGCRRPTETILPFAKQPEGYIHGVPQFYATAMPTRGSAIPLVARSNDGRPTKVEGNALHPDSNGGTDQFAQASILNLYDVDRAMRYAKKGAAVKREEAVDGLANVGKQFAANGGEGLAFLLERSSSPSRARVIAQLKAKYANAKWFIYEPVDFDIHRQVASLVTRKEVRPYVKFDAAKAILSLDSDFLGAEEDSYIGIRRFAKGRRVEKSTDSMNRLYVAESLMSLTGTNADHRLRVTPSQVLALAARVAVEVLKAAPGTANLQAALQPLAAAFKGNEKWAVECAKDLAASRGQSVVVVGYQQPLAVHAIAYAINQALGNLGQTITFLPEAQPAEGSITELATLLNAGKVDTLVISGGNPVYNAPADLNWAGSQRKAKTVIRLGYYEDESAEGVDWHLPLAHYLESWGDARTADGTVVPIQPLVEPLFGGITEIEVLARLGGLNTVKPHDIVRETFGSVFGGNEEGWKKFLHDGVIAGSALTPVAAQTDYAAVTQLLAAAKAPAVATEQSLEVVFHRDHSVDDGRYTNNGWLQELPDPVTKMVWENVILLSAKTAAALQIVVKDKEDMDLQVPIVKVSVNGREVEGPAWVQPGMADNVIGLALGYGRLKTGRVGKGSGYDAYRVRVAATPALATGAKLVAVGKQHPLSTTQNHGAMEGRPIIREANLEQFRAHPTFAKGMNMHEPPGPRDPQGRPAPLYENPLDIKGADGLAPRDRAVHAWGMSIDLTTCVGCSACMMACQSENNVPIVGKDQVKRNREMHWIRLDRYYTGNIEDPQVVQQPMLCQHCESAPCESVCPVNATVHDEEGLNVMAYNRCVGTRYCSNNCPYKVRRYNYLDFNGRPLDKLVGPVYSSPLVNVTDGEWDVMRWWKNPGRGIRPDDEWELLKLVKNPDVTVRMRGIMEKCSFCVQRVEQAKISQKVKAGASGDIAVPDGTFKTACQQACPAEAIVTGNLKDPNSKVSKLKGQERDYTVLDFLSTKPRTTYLAKIRNPNPAMPDYYAKPQSFVEWEKRGNSLEDHGGHETGHAEPAAAGQAEKKGAH